MTRPRHPPYQSVNVYLFKHHADWLSARAASTRQSRALVIRRLIDDERAREATAKALAQSIQSENHPRRAT
jgi:hypothetical protein